MTMREDAAVASAETSFLTRPLAAGSLIVTLFGDAILPRGGVLSLAAITRLLEPFGHNSGQIRTALSRLVVDGWFERRRDGRASYYALSDRRAAEFVQATQRVYWASQRADQLKFIQAVVVEPDQARRLTLRERLLAEGFVAAAPGILLAACPAGEPPFMAQRDGIVFADLAIASSDDRDLARWGRALWPLDQLAADYAELLKIADALAQTSGAGLQSDDRSAFVTRLLLLHHYRRIVLRDPQLAPRMLPADWSGARARHRIGEVYRAVLVPSERWMTAEVLAVGENLPPADDTLSTRFS